jgi:hypothetical protein
MPTCLHPQYFSYNRHFIESLLRGLHEIGGTDILDIRLVSKTYKRIFDSLGLQRKNRVYVNGLTGNDETATRESISNKFKTFESALKAVQPGDWVNVYNVTIDWAPQPPNLEEHLNDNRSSVLGHRLPPRTRWYFECCNFGSPTMPSTMPAIVLYPEAPAPAPAPAPAAPSNASILRRQKRQRRDTYRWQKRR